MAVVRQPKPLDQALGTQLVKQVSGPAHRVREKSLDAQVSAAFGGRYAVSSSRYFSVSADVPWVAISKNVQNQMLEAAVSRGHYPKENPGIMPIDYYPQPHGAFVLAMDKKPGRHGEKLVGYFALHEKCPA